MKIIVLDYGKGGKLFADEISYQLNIEVLYTKLNNLGIFDTKTERIKKYRQIIMNLFEQFEPDKLVIACNSISVYFEELNLEVNQRNKVICITECNLELLKINLVNERNKIYLFSSATTVNSGFYQRRIDDMEINVELIAIPCTDLAHSITLGLSQEKIKSEIKKYMSMQQVIIDTDQKIFCLIGCTHYSLHSELFKDVMIEYGYEDVKLLDLHRNFHILAEKLEIK